MKQVNDRAESYADATPGLTYVDVMTPMLDTDGQPRAELFSADGLHMNAEGYAIWTKTLKPLLLEL
jgi:lysophospholipase L1-like esterase